jgi:D-tyrosyl-tRNA(Tyr) deacylase
VRVVVQRVSEASVRVGGRDVGRIARGFLVLAGFAKSDDDAVLGWMARKVATLRVFEDGEGRMNLPIDAVDGSILVVSQFTLYGDCRKGARPGFDRSAPPDVARDLYGRFVTMLEAHAPGRVATGEFQATMSVSLVNEGPVTLVIEKEAASP